MSPRLGAKLSEGSRPYIIFRPYLGAGFWSNFFWVIMLLDFADEQGLVPVVDMERYPTRYNEDGGEAATALGTRNGWEYYFEQPGGLSLADALTRSPMDNNGSMEPRIGFDLGIPGGLAGMPRIRELMGKYIRVKPEILRQADAILPPGLNPTVLGVHVRGTDLRAAEHPGHPVPAPLLCYLETAQQLDREHHFERIYLASDELEAVTAFEDAFGPRLVTTAAHRTSASVETPMDYKWLFDHQRPLHRYLLGLEVLLDTLLLARCGHFVCGPSNVGRGALAFSHEDQIRHFLPPLWCTPRRAHPSVGFEYISMYSNPGRIYSAAAHQLIEDELRRLLARSEDAAAAAQQQVEKLQARSLLPQGARILKGLRRRVLNLVTR